MTLAQRLRYPLYLFSLSHGLHDFFTGVWVLVLAAQRDALGLTYTEIGIAQALYTIATALAQPSFGHYFDRTGTPHRAIWAVAGTTLMVLGAALAPNYALLVVAGVGAGLGSASYHAAGLGNARRLADGRGPGRATAIFLLLGNGGFALGAAVGGFVLDAYGARALTVPALAIVFTAPFLVRALQPVLAGREAGRKSRTAGDLLRGGRTALLPIVAFMLLVTANQFYFGAFTTYLPQFFEEGGASLRYAGNVTSVYLLFAAFGSFVGGTLSDVLPRRVVAGGAMVIIAPLSFLVLRSDGVSLLGLSVLLGLATNISLPILLLIGQEIMPGGASGAGGYAFGFTFLARAVTTPIVGALGDSFSLLAALTISGLVPLFAVGFMMLLPHPALANESA
ncbi:MAG: MFS transporter [Anaerolineales bacterium]